MSHDLLDLDTLQRAHARVGDSVHHTPLLESATLSNRVGRRIALKAEHLQKTGSFKVRGALHFMLRLPPAAADRGVVTISAGNHAQAVAWAAGRAGIPARVVMPETAPRSKVAASRGYGAEVILHGNVFEAFQLALDLAEEEELTFVHPFDHPHILAGQAGVGLELLEQCPAVATVVVPIGGGGLCAGVAAALRASGSDARIVGVEPEGACAMRRSLDEGRAVRLDTVDTIADGLGAPMAGDLTFPLIRDLVDDVLTVSDPSIAAGLVFLFERCKQVVEPGGAAAVAALLDGLVPDLDGPVVAILSGGNVDAERISDFAVLAREHATASGTDTR